MAAAEICGRTDVRALERCAGIALMDAKGRRGLPIHCTEPIPPPCRRFAATPGCGGRGAQCEEARKTRRSRRRVSMFLLSFSLTLGPPLVVAVLLAVGRVRSQLDWLLSVLLCAGVALHAQVAGPIWTWIGFGWRWLPLGIAAAGVLWSARQARTRPILPPRASRRFVHTAVRGAVAVGDRHPAPRSAHRPERSRGAVDLGFPLEPGRYAVAQGGASRVLNHHPSWSPPKRTPSTSWG